MRTLVVTAIVCLCVVTLVAAGTTGAEPKAPTGVAASDGTFCDRVRVTWDDPNDSAVGVVSYTVLRSSDKTGGYKEIGAAVPPAPGKPAPTFYDDMSAGPGFYYYYRVQACKTTLCGVASEPDMGFRPHPGIGSTPVDGPEFVVQGDYCDGVHVYWWPVGWATSYQVWRSTNLFIGYEVMADKLTSASYVDTKAVVGTKYYYRVAACGECGCTGVPYGEGREVERTPCSGIPGTPGSVKASADEVCCAVRVTWSEVGEAKNYEVWRSEDGTSYGKLGEWWPDSPNVRFDDHNPLRGATTYYAVLACNDYGCSALSASASVTLAGSKGLPCLCLVPGIPVGLTAKEYCWGVRLRWDRVVTAESYQVWRSTKSDRDFVQIATVKDEPSYEFYWDTNLALGTTYYYKVAACTSAGCSALSDSVSGKAPGTLLLPDPAWVKATDGTYPNEVQVAWAPVVGAASYDVWRSTGMEGGYAWIGNATAPSLSYDDKSATPGIVYSYRVSAYASCVRQHGLSLTGDTGYAGSLPSPGVPSAPENVAATDGTYTDKIHVTWTGSSGATEYHVMRSLSPSGSYSRVTTTSAAKTYDDMDKALVPGTVYYYEVIACNGTGCSAPSDYDGGALGVLDISLRPPIPTNVSASDGTYSNKVSITWWASGATTYNVWRATSETGHYSVVWGGTPSVLQGGTDGGLYYAEDSTASAGQTYYYKVQACVDSRCSGLSDCDTGYVGSAPPGPSAPTGVDASDGTYTDKVLVTWNAVAGAASYGVQRCSSPTGTYFVIGTALSTSFEDRTAVAETTYYYKVQACDASTCGDFSGYDAGYRAAGPPVKVTGVDATDGTDPDKVQVTWDALPGATSYRVYRTTSPSFSGGVYLGEMSSTSYNDTGATSGVTYYYWVQAMDQLGLLGDLSDPDVGYRGSEAPIPGEPTGVTASTTYCDGVHVAWNSVSGATSYEVWRKEAGSGEDYSSLPSAGSNSYIDASAEAGKEYNYKIKACNDSGCSDFSDRAKGMRTSPGC